MTAATLLSTKCVTLRTAGQLLSCLGIGVASQALAMHLNIVPTSITGLDMTTGVISGFLLGCISVEGMSRIYPTALSKKLENKHGI